MYAMLMPQPRLVRLLEKRARDLGVDVRWGHELVGIAPGAESVALSVASQERDYAIAAGYAVGADGGRSLVRKSLGINFPGTTSPMVARLAHAHSRPVPSPGDRQHRGSGIRSASLRAQPL